MCSGTVPEGHVSQKARNPKPGYHVLHSGLAETEQGDSCIEELGNQLQISSGNIWWSLGPFKNPGRATATLIWGQAGKEWLALPLGLPPPPHSSRGGGFSAHSLSAEEIPLACFRGKTEHTEVLGGSRKDSVTSPFAIKLGQASQLACLYPSLPVQMGLCVHAFWANMCKLPCKIEIAIQMVVLVF